MKILVVVPSYKPAYGYGGPIRSIAALCESLVEHGHEVTVITTNANGKNELDVSIEELQLICGVSVIYFKRITGDHSNFSPRLVKFFYKHVRDYDVIHIQSWWNMVVIPAAIICRFCDVTPVISPRGSLSAYTLSYSKSRLKLWFHSLVGKRLLDSVILHLTTKREFEETSKLVKSLNSFVIPNILNLESISKSSKKEDTVFTVLFLGRLHPAKNLELLLEIFSQSFTFPIRLLIAGSGQPEYVEPLKQSTLQNSAIEWLGSVEGDEKNELLSSADLLVMPSHIENFGNVILEALILGTPVFVSETVGLKDFIIEHNLGKIVKSDAISWKSAIENFYYDISFRDDIEKRAPDIVKGYMDKTYLIRQYEDMYDYARKL